MLAVQTPLAATEGWLFWMLVLISFLCSRSLFVASTYSCHLDNQPQRQNHTDIKVGRNEFFSLGKRQDFPCSTSGVSTMSVSRSHLVTSDFSYAQLHLQCGLTTSKHLKADAYTMLNNLQHLVRLIPPKAAVVHSKLQQIPHRA